MKGRATETLGGGHGAAPSPDPPGAPTWGPGSPGPEPNGRDGHPDPTDTRRHIRGSSLLFAGRIFALLANFATQVLTVRYLSKSDYGAFAYALSVTAMATSGTLLGMNQTLSRFVPIYQERGDWARFFGTMLVAGGSVTGLGLALCLVVFGLRDALTGEVQDPASITLLVILISLAPMQALDNVFQSLLAVLASPRAIFFRRHVLAPLLRITAVLAVMASGASVLALSWGYVAAGLIGVVLYAWMFRQILARQGLLKEWRACRPRLPVRKLFAFGLPVLTSDLMLLLRVTLAVVVLEAARGTESVAEFRAVLPVAGLIMLVYQSMKLLFMPAAARLFAREDAAGVNELYAQTTIWIAVLSFPFFAANFLCSDFITVLLFGERYQQAGILLCILAVGEYFNASMGLNTVIIQVYGRIRLLLTLNVVGAAASVLLCLWLIRSFGQVGAAVAVTGSLVFHNLIYHLGLHLKTEVQPFSRATLRPYGTILGAIALMLALRAWGDLPVPVGLVVGAALSWALVRLNRSALRLDDTFPELRRIPGVTWLFGLPSAR